MMAGSISSNSCPPRRRSSSFSCDATLPWDKFHYWIHCICVVTFDLEIGQTIELVMPKYAKLTEKEKTNICYLAFPDSNSGCMGDTKFHFRIRCLSGIHSYDAKYCEFLNRYNQLSPPPLTVDPNYYFGFVYFRQNRDKSLPRGYLQKSLVIITRLPFVNLFLELVERIALQYFKFYLPGLEAACSEVDHWPLPSPASTLSLPLLGTVLRVRLPSNRDKVDFPEAPNAPIQTPLSSTCFLSSAYEPNFYEHLSPVLAHIHFLWELVLIGEPLAIMAPSPSVCSNVVHCLVNLIFPLRCCSDYRPFFTIHDTEFKEFTSKSCNPPATIIGVTNPFFTKTLENWPNVVRIGEGFFALSSKPSPNLNHKVKKGGNLKILDSNSGIYSKYKPYLVKDKTLLKKLIKGVETRRPTEVQSAIIKRHFSEITQSFLMPLERYITSLMPLHRNISPWKGSPRMGEFKVEEFLSLLENSGPHLTSCIKGDWIRLYRHFFLGPNFQLWFNQRQQEVDQKLEILHLEVLCASSIYKDLSEKQEVELVDLVLKIRDKLKFIDDNKDRISIHLRSKLIKLYETVLNSLRDDLKSVLLSNQKLNIDSIHIDEKSLKDTSSDCSS